MAKTIRFSMRDDESKSFSFSMANPLPELEEEGGADLAQAVVEQLITDQPFSRMIAECTKVEIVERKVNRIL